MAVELIFEALVEIQAYAEQSGNNALLAAATEAENIAHDECLKTWMSMLTEDEARLQNCQMVFEKSEEN